MEKGKMLQIDGMTCCVLSSQNIGGSEYIYVAEVYDDDITEKFFVYKVTPDREYEKITNSNDLKRILPIFIDAMNKDLEEE